MIVGTKGLDNGCGCCHSTAESCGAGTTFQRGNSSLQHLSIRIAVAAVHVPMRIRSLSVPLERGGKVNWCSDCSGRRIDSVAGVNCQGFDFHRMQCNCGAEFVKAQCAAHACGSWT